jgi:hypothetical protein
MNTPERGFKNPEYLSEDFIHMENEFEEEMRDRVLIEHLFHDAHLDQILNSSTVDTSTLIDLHHEFVEEKKKRNFGARFDLALQPKFLGIIKLVELGISTNPGRNGEADGLKAHYLEHLDWMMKNVQWKEYEKDPDQFPVGELPREKSRRTITTRQPQCKTAKDSLVIVERNRPLINSLMDHSGETVHVRIGKRMLFALPKKTIDAIEQHIGKVSDPSGMNTIENMLDHKAEIITPIRTGYYLATDLFED